MRSFLALTIVWPLVISTVTWGQAVPPTTQPNFQPTGAMQINQPLAVPAKNLVVFPFRSFNNSVRYGWIGKALQETTISSMTGIAGIQPVILPPKIATPDDDLAAVARDGIPAHRWWFTARIKSWTRISASSPR